MRTSLQSFLERAVLANADFSGRVESAFEDVDALIELYFEEMHQLGSLDPWGGDEVQIDEWFRRSRRRDALHKAVIEYTCVAFTVTIHELRGRPNSEMNVCTMLKKSWAKGLSDINAWRELYALTQYRHKLVAHHEVVRTNGGMGNPKHGVWRLMPSPVTSGLPANSIVELREIAVEAGLADAPGNPWELVSYAFWNAPITPGRDVSPARRRIDSLAECVGVQSLTVKEIDDLIDRGLSDIGNIGVPGMRNEPVTTEEAVG